MYIFLISSLLFSIFSNLNIGLILICSERYALPEATCICMLYVAVDTLEIAITFKQRTLLVHSNAFRAAQG